MYKNHRDIKIYFNYDKAFEIECWHLEIEGSNTINCYAKAEQLIEALKNYFGLNKKVENK